MKNNNTIVILGVSAAISVIVVVYLLIHTHKKKCEKGSIMKNGKCVPNCGEGTILRGGTCVPKCNWDDKITCPTYTEAVCNSDTNFEWICESTSGCDDTPPKCTGGDIPTCNSETKKWECPIQKCSQSPPPDLECPDDNNLYMYVKRCDEQTRNKWVCQKACLETPPKSFDPKSCTSNQQPACSAATNFLWSCQDLGSDVCGINPRPTCAGAICFDTNSGWDWKCPGDLTRDDVKLLKSLQCRDIVNGDDNTKKVNICFSGDTPIAPSVSSNCDEQNPNMEIGQDFTNVIDNPEGNITLGSNGTKIFYPYDPTKRIYRKADQSDVACILSMDLQNGCKNGGKFQQTNPGISKEGKCACINGWTGKTCQYSDALCNGHGKVDSNGKCKCDYGYFSVDDIKAETGPYKWDPIYFSSGQCKVTAKDKCYTYQCIPDNWDGDEDYVKISKPLPCSPSLKKANNKVYKMYTTTESDCSKYTQKSPNGCMKAEGCQHACTNNSDESSCKCIPYPDKDPQSAGQDCG